MLRRVKQLTKCLGFSWNRVWVHNLRASPIPRPFFLLLRRSRLLLIYAHAVRCLPTVSTKDQFRLCKCEKRFKDLRGRLRMDCSLMSFI